MKSSQPHLTFWKVLVGKSRGKYLACHTPLRPHHEVYAADRWAYTEQLLQHSAPHEPRHTCRTIVDGIFNGQIRVKYNASG